MKHSRKLAALVVGSFSLGMIATAHAADTDPAVKKSKSNICHEKGSEFYARVKKFTPFDTLDACLKSGGRMPKENTKKGSGKKAAAAPVVAPTAAATPTPAPAKK